jgi:hypothetical protein
VINGCRTSLPPFVSMLPAVPFSLAWCVNMRVDVPRTFFSECPPSNHPPAFHDVATHTRYVEFEHVVSRAPDFGNTFRIRL